MRRPGGDLGKESAWSQEFREGRGESGDINVSLVSRQGGAGSG